MGNTLTQNPFWLSTDYNTKLSEHDLTFVKSVEDPRLGHIDEFTHNPTSQTLLRKEIPLTNESQLTNENLRKFKARVHLRHRSLLTIYGFALDLPQDGPKKIGIYFEQFASDSTTEFLANQQNQTYFTEEELYESILAVLEGLAYLQNHSISHGCLTPDSVLMSEDGEIKILDHSLFESENSAYFACLQGHQISYIAPELVRLLDNNTPIPSDFNPFKADVFSLGMTFLFGALLEEPTDCYDWESSSFDEAKLAERLAKLKARYPGKLSYLLTQMLEVSPAERPTAISLLTNLNKGLETIKASPKRADDYTSEKKAEMYKSYEHYTPKDTSNSHYLSFVDPKVAQLIKEIREKTPNKATGSPDTYHSKYLSEHLTRSERNDALASPGRYKYSIPAETIHKPDLELRYRNPFVEGYASHIASGIVQSRPVQLESPREPLRSERDILGLSFNRPEVNQIIASFYNTNSNFSPVHTQLYSQNSTILREHLGLHEIQAHKEAEKQPEVEKIPAVERVVMQAHYETPQKKDYNQLVREADRYFWGSGAKASNADVPLDSGKYSKKIQSKEEIIRELRGKFGSKKAEDQPKQQEIEYKSEQIATSVN